MSARHCCETMEMQIALTCPVHTDRHECPDCLISHTPKFREYGIIIHNGGTSTMSIQFCPWCGTALPKSERDRWFSELEARGIDPSTDDVPDVYADERWIAGK